MYHMKQVKKGRRIEWVLDKCECGSATIIKKGNKIVCRNCGKVIEEKIDK